METTVKNKVGSLILNPLPVKSGLRQGGALSPNLFNNKKKNILILEGKIF